MSHVSEQKQWIAVLGGATRYGRDQIIAAYKTGQEIARQGGNLLTGGTTGIPYAAAMGAKHGGALVVGISPAASFEEHVERYRKPLDYADLIVYTGIGYGGRSPVIVQSVCGAIFIGGEIGTLYEFSAAWMTGNNVIGILQSGDGITEQLQSIMDNIKTTWGSSVLFGRDPVTLARKVCEEANSVYSTRLSQLRCEEIGKDTKDMICQFLNEEREAQCAERSASTRIGVSSTINLL